MSEEYSLSKSTKGVGQLYPVILSKDGEVVDGFHRLDADPSWRTEIREELDTPEKVVKAKIIANKFRRQVTAEEVKEWINELAEIAVNEYSIEAGQISGWIAEETGYSLTSVRGYLNTVYKDKEQRDRALATPTVAEPTYEPFSVELDAIDTLGAEKYEQLEKHIRQEAKKEILENPKEIKKIIDRELEKPEVLKKAVKKAEKKQIIKTPKPQVTFSGEVCQFIDTEKLKPKEGGKDYSHLALFPKCLCQTCEHFQKCRGGELI